ncbi:hypothetical protein [Desulfobacter sp.]|uniref:hypothetical protein n=1 Tax=Desulfobacter sp. TaxID=2294 RepID=UPI003D13F360
MNELTGHIMKDAHRYRGLDPVSKDQELILALSDPAFLISFDYQVFSNKLILLNITVLSINSKLSWYNFLKCNNINLLFFFKYFWPPKKTISQPSVYRAEEKT